MRQPFRTPLLENADPSTPSPSITMYCFGGARLTMKEKNDLDNFIPTEVSHHCQAAQKSAILGKLKKRSTLKSLRREGQMLARPSVSRYPRPSRIREVKNTEKSPYHA